MNVAVILAGGTGTRLGADLPKQFIEIFGKPVLVYTIEAFQNHPEIDLIEVVCLESYLETMEKLIQTYGLTKAKLVVKGGENYQWSVIHGIFGLRETCHPEDIVLVHWGASSFVEADIISDCIRVSKEKGNAISTTPFYPLAGIRDGEETSSQWLDRETVACMSSPHGFRYEFIRNLYEEAIETGIIDTVEPHQHTLMYAMGKTIYFSKGSQANVKITTKEDLLLFRGYVLAKKLEDVL